MSLNSKVAMDVLATQIARKNRGESDAADYLQVLGFVSEQRVDKKLSPEQTLLSEQGANPPSPEAFTPLKPAFGFDFFTLTSRKRLPHDSDESQQPAVTAFSSDDDKPTVQATPKPEIEPITPLLMRLQRMLKQHKTGHRLAIKPLVKQMARQQLPTHMPLLTNAHDPDQLTIYLDTSSNISGLATDGFMVCRALVLFLPHCRCQIIVLPDGPQGRWAYLNDTQPQPGPLVLPDSGDSCLIVTGLTEHNACQWRFLLADLAAKAIKPCWLSVSWTSLPGSHINWGKTTSDNLPEHCSQPIAPLDLLSAILGTCRIITGAMLRQLIQSLGLAAYYETAFWQQSRVSYQAGADTGFINQHGVSNGLLKFLPATTLEQLSDIIEPHLAAIGSSSLHEHRIHLSLVQAQSKSEKLRESEKFFESLTSSMRGDDQHSHNIAQYLTTTVQQYDGLIEHADSAVQQTLAQACAYHYQQQSKYTIPAVLADKVQQLIKKSNPKTQIIKLGQRGHQLSFEQEQQALPSAPLLASFEHSVAAPLLSYPKGDKFNKPQNSQTITPEGNHTVNDSSEFILQSSTEQLSFKRYSSNDFYWAKTLSVTAKGVVATTEYIRVSWPASIDGNQNINGEVIEVLDHAPQWLRNNPPKLDQYGLFVVLSIKKDGIKSIELKLRYIPPGSFLMGSPMNEPEREENETQHPVTLTQGFWMGETTVTQQLWQAMMGTNPSRFQGDENHQKLPVEQVDWDDCQQFCQQLSSFVPELSLILPTEAQWEYACRAGTLTSFSTGELLTTEQANYDGNYPYNNGDKGGYQEKPIPADALTPNNWGLHQMHGNVWEWCQDARRDYQAEAIANPAGDDEQSGRVLRGGSWLNGGRGCRSAFRYWLHRDDASDFIGLRVTQVEPARERVAPAAPIRSGARADKGKASDGSSTNLIQNLLNKLKRK